MRRNRNGFKILSKERPCSLSNYTKGALLYGGTPYVRPAEEVPLTPRRRDSPVDCYWQKKPRPFGRGSYVGITYLPG